MRQKGTDMQRREDRIIQLEEELKYKITEVARQLTQKEEEIMSIKVKFKEERQSLEVDKKRLQKEVQDSHNLIEQASQRYHQLKQEVEESPLQTLRLELGAKQLEITSLQTKVKQAQDSTNEYQSKFELLKKDMV